MRQTSNIFNNLIPLALLAALAWVVVGGFIAANNDLDAARAACYESTGVEVCER